MLTCPGSFWSCCNAGGLLLFSQCETPTGTHSTPQMSPLPPGISTALLGRLCGTCECWELSWWVITRHWEPLKPVSILSFSLPTHSHPLGHLTPLKPHWNSKGKSPNQNKQAFPNWFSLSKDFVCCPEYSKANKSWISRGWCAWTNEQNAYYRCLCVCVNISLFTARAQGCQILIFGAGHQHEDNYSVHVHWVDTMENCIYTQQFVNTVD